MLIKIKCVTWEHCRLVGFTDHHVLTLMPWAFLASHLHRSCAKAKANCSSQCFSMALSGATRAEEVGA